MDKSSLLQSLRKKNFPEKIINAFAEVPRENFISQSMKNLAYEDTPLPIGNNQTISQPYTIAVMLDLLELEKEQNILEVGSGSGYVLTLISKITGEKGKVYGIEIIPELVEKSKSSTRNYKNVEIYNRDGNLGLKEKSPFQRILISARTEKIPEELIKQLKENGIIVAPIGNSYSQDLISYKKIKGKLKIQKRIPGFVFVPLIGKEEK